MFKIADRLSYLEGYQLEKMSVLAAVPTTTQKSLDEFRFGTKHRFTVTQEVNAPAEAVWTTLKTFESYNDWQPMIADMNMITEQKTGVNAERQAFYFGGDAKVSEKMVEFDEDKRYLTYLMYNTNKPVKVAYWCWSVEDMGEKKSKVTINLQYTMKFGFIGLLINKFLFTKILPKNLRKNVIPSLEKHANSV